jgi:hypothetical protein
MPHLRSKIQRNSFYGQARTARKVLSCEQEEAHVQVIKNREGRKLKTVEVRVTHGSQKRVNLELLRLGYNIANTSAIERQNGSVRANALASV